MCGRYTLSISVDELWDELELEGDPPADDARLRPRYNIAPTQEVPIVAAREPGQLRHFRWGLVPRWAEDASIGSRMINARSETAAIKPAFRAAFRKRRCLLVADGFYEWRRDPGGEKTPFYFRLASGKPFGLAGLWESWKPPDGSETLRSCAILTIPAAPPVAQVHDRMPVMLTGDRRTRWLDESIETETLRALLAPLAPELVTAWEVTRAVGSPRNDGPHLIAPQRSPDDGAP